MLALRLPNPMAWLSTCNIPASRPVEKKITRALDALGAIDIEKSQQTILERCPLRLKDTSKFFHADIKVPSHSVKRIHSIENPTTQISLP